MTTRPAATVKAPTPVDALKDIRRSLQDAGIAVLRAATDAVGAAADETLSATRSVLASADDTLAAAEKRVRKLRSPGAGRGR